MSGKDLDRRIQKTLQHLQNALADLIAEKEYDDITIQDILDRANVGRSTFYAHFENKDQLLRSLLTQLNERYEDGIQRLKTSDKPLAEHGAQMPFNILQFVEQNQRVFKAMLRQQGQNTNPFYDYLFVLTKEHFRSMIGLEQSDTLRLEMVTHYYTNAFIGVLRWWLESDLAYPAEDLGRMMNQLTLPGIEAAFEGLG